MNPEERIKSKRRVLQKMRVVAMQMAPAVYVDRHLDLDIVEDYLSWNLLYRLHSHVLAEDLGTREYEVCFSYPANPWQHFKRDWLPDWFLRHFRRLRTIKNKTEVKKVIGHGYRGYPNAPIVLPEDRMGQSVVFETFELEP